MAYANDKKPGELTALTALATDDVFVVGDTSDVSEVAKGITKANLLTDLASTFAPVLGADDNYVTDAEKAALHAYQTSIVGITGNKAQFDTAVTDGNFMYTGDTPTSHTHVAADITDFSTAVAATASVTANTAKVTNATHTGDVTGSTALTIAAGAVTLAKMANLAQDQVIIRTTASTGVPETATITAAARTVLDDITIGAMVNTLGGATSTGTGGIARATSPTFVTPVLGTPTSGTLTNCTGLPEAGVVGLTTALGLKAPLASPTFTGTVAGITATMVGLGNVDNTSNATERAATATLTNKTMTGTTNTITASVLKSATTEVNVSSATAPSSGQVLTATSSTAATWQTPSASGGTQTINTEAAGSATLLVAEISTSTANILNIVESNAAAQTITLPTADAGDVGKWYQIYNSGTNRMTITSASSLLGDSVILAAKAGCVAYISSTGNYTLVGTGNQTQEIQMPCTDWTTNLTVGDGKYYLRIPSKFNGWEITGVHAEVITAGTTGTTDIQLHNVTDAVDILSTKLTIDSTEQGTDTAVTAAVINASNKNLATEDRIRVDVDAISTTAPQGLIVSLTIQPL